MVGVMEYWTGPLVTSVLSPIWNEKLVGGHPLYLHLQADRVVPLRDVGDCRLHLKAARAGLGDGEADGVLGIKILLDQVSRDT